MALSCAKTSLGWGHVHVVPSTSFASHTSGCKHNCHCSTRHSGDPPCIVNHSQHGWVSLILNIIVVGGRPGTIIRADFLVPLLSDCGLADLLPFPLEPIVTNPLLIFRQRSSMMMLDLQQNHKPSQKKYWRQYHAKDRE